MASFWQKKQQPDQNLELIEQFAGEELRKGIHKKMENEIQGILSNMIGRNTENNLIDKLELLLHERRGLLLNGFNVRENLKLFFDAFNVKLKEYPKNTKSSTGGKIKLPKERKRRVLGTDDYLSFIYIEGLSVQRLSVFNYLGKNDWSSI